MAAGKVAGESMTCGQLLRRYRQAARLTQEALAERSGYSANYVSKLERDQRQPPRVARERLADVLELGSDEREALRAAHGPSRPAPEPRADEPPPDLSPWPSPLLALLLAGSVPAVLAQAQTCQFALGFATRHDAVGADADRGQVPRERGPDAHDDQPLPASRDPHHPGPQLGQVEDSVDAGRRVLTMDVARVPVAIVACSCLSWLAPSWWWTTIP